MKTNTLVHTITTANFDNFFEIHNNYVYTEKYADYPYGNENNF